MSGGNFPTPGPSAWPGGAATNLAGEYFSFDTSPSSVATFIGKCNTNGLIPFVELEPWHFSQAGVPFSDITNGVWDTWLTGVGSAIASNGKPVILTFAHEFNVSGQYPWAQGMKGSGPGGGTVTPSQWITTWNYAKNKVNSTAGGYAIWMWACSAWTGGSTVDPTPWWPGISNLDMVGIDGYPNTQYGASLGTFAGQIQKTVTTIRNLGWSDDIYLSETNLAGMVASGGESITNFVKDMHAAGCSGIFEFEESYEPDMSSAQWTEYHTAVATYYGTSTGGGGTGGGGTGGGGSGTLTYTKGTADEVHAASGVAHSVTPVSPPAGSMVHWSVAWLNSNDTLGLTFTAQDSAGNSYGPPTRKGTPGDGDGGCYLLVWDHTYSAAPGAITLTVTASGSGVSGAAPSDCLILPYVITGQAADQTGAAFNNFSEAGTSTTTYQISLTPTVPGSEIFLLAAPNHNSGATGPVTAISGSTTDADWDDAGVGSRGTFGHSTNPTTSLTSTTYGWTSANPSPFGYGVMALEIVPAVTSSPKMSTLVDSFSGTSLNTGLWQDVNGTLTVANNSLVMPVTTAYSLLQSDQAYDLTGSYAFCRINPDQGGNGYETSLMVHNAAVTYGYAFGYINGNLLAQAYTNGAWGTAFNSIPYDPAAHAWVRIREAAGTLYYETSPDSQVWTTRATSNESNVGVTSLYARVFAGYASPGATNGTSYVYDFNVTSGTGAVITSILMIGIC